MALNYDELVTRTPVFDRQREIVFFRLAMETETSQEVMPLLLRMVNSDPLNAGYFLPLAWVQDEVILSKLSRNVVLIASPSDQERIVEAQTREYRIALEPHVDDQTMPCDFALQTLPLARPASPNTVLLGIDTPQQFQAALETPAMLFCGDTAATAVLHNNSKRINPAHTLILELMAAVQQEAEARDIELMFKRDIALSFKLLRYINSPGFGLATRVDSIRHALSILGYQQLLKWLTLLAATAGQSTSPALTQTAITRARLLELLGTRHLEKREADNLFMTGMLSLLDRIVGLPLPEILANVNLSPSIADVLLRDTGKYRRYLQLAMACEGQVPESPDAQPEMDAKSVNNAHFDAMEWAAAISRTMK